MYHSTYKDNKFLDDVTKENIEELANRNEAYYKIYALGQLATLDKLIFPKYEKRLLNKDGPEMKKLPSFFGLDFGLKYVAPLHSNMYRKFGELTNVRCVAYFATLSVKI